MKKKGDRILCSSSENFVDSSNEFGFKLYSNIKGKDSGNVFFSPYSISSAMTLVYEGAEGKTEDEMRKVFGFTNDYFELRKAYKQVYEIINKREKSYDLKTANALWVEKTYKLLSDYTKTIKKYYGGKLNNLDFKNNSEGSRTKINKWVENQTNKKIKDLLPKGSVKPATKVVLTNAVHFKGDWAKPFEEKLTKKEAFKTLGKTVQAEMMRFKKLEHFRYLDTGDLQVLDLPYKGDELSMTVFLPKTNSLKSLESKLNSKDISNIRGNLQMRKVDVYLPKFKFDTYCSLTPNLKELGLSTAFSSSADFSGMSGKKDLAISDVVHKAFVDVNEKGTEAAAATGVIIGVTSVVVPPMFRADHPFLFTIQENTTGTVLFFGRIIDPTK
ncbi:serpin family protein [Candidatus Woesearchaeota archaeon]|nr:serpin family protein [Candidatus Woesearchaeota archaeon]